MLSELLTRVADRPNQEYDVVTQCLLLGVPILSEGADYVLPGPEATRQNPS